MKYIHYTVKGYDKKLTSGPYEEEEFLYHLDDIKTFENVTILGVCDGPEQAKGTPGHQVCRKGHM